MGFYSNTTGVLIREKGHQRTLSPSTYAEKRPCYLHARLHPQGCLRRGVRFGLRPQGPCGVGTGESGLVLSEEGNPAGLSSRDAGLLEPPERPQGSPASSSVWREDPGLLSRPCRKRRPSAHEDGARQERRFPCVVWKGFPAFPAHLRMRPVSRGNSRRATWGQASSCLRKGTPLASRVAQGVSGPSSHA